MSKFSGTAITILVVLHVAVLAIVSKILYDIHYCKDVKEGYYLGEYYKLRQCRCIPQYDKPTFTSYN